MTKQIPLTRGKFALVDDDDYERLSQYQWFCTNWGYAARNIEVNGKRGTLYMHVEINNTPAGKQTDHINMERLDNRRSNLRVCSRSENIRNTKIDADNKYGYKGVSLKKSSNKWQATICINQQRMWVGSFTDIIEAARAYDEKARELFGKFARLNFPRDGEQKA